MAKIESCEDKVRRLQKKLKGMPLVPQNSRMRKQVDKTQKELVDTARKCGMISKIDLFKDRRPY